MAYIARPDIKKKRKKKKRKKGYQDMARPKD